MNTGLKFIFHPKTTVNILFFNENEKTLQKG